MPRRRTRTSAEVKTNRKLSLRAVITQALVRFLPKVKGGPQS